MVNAIATANTSFSTSLKTLVDYPDTGMISKVLLKDNNCQYTLFCLAKGTAIEEHTSPRNAAITVIEGKGILTLDQKEITLEAGVFIFIPAKAPHKLQAQENLKFMLTLSEKPKPVNQVSQETIDIIKSTAPLLKKNGKQITTRMYEIMFHNHPEVKAQFDMSAQANGSQPAKLATAVYSYASKIDNPEALKSMVEVIAHRHVKTHVKPEQYPIVGESLLQAMKDVLHEAATEEVIAAWTEAYQILADIFINREHQIYQSL
ncbi:MAG: cupin domain-containing protein [Moorea sp. SIO2I5]|nr:cupin domain-containing protein [Moorena sp. SIO2I5]